GITRFKSQKKEALRKLELTEANLLRVTDVIKEVNRQIGSLQRQASKARRYKEFADRLRELDTKLAARHFRALKDSVQEGERKVSALQQELLQLRGVLEEKESVLRRKRMDAENLEEKTRLGEQQKSRLENEKNHAVQKIEFHRQRIQELEGLVERNRLDVAATEEKIRVQQEQLNALGTDLAALNQELQNLNADLQQQQTVWQERKNAVAACSRERETLDAEILANNRQAETHRARLADLEAQKRGHLLHVEKLREDEKNGETRLQEIRAEAAALSSRLVQEEEEIKKAEAAIEEKKKALAAAQQFAHQQREEFEKLRNERASLGARHEALEQLAAERAGYSETTRALLERHRGQGVHGALLEYIQAKPGFERAVELCLGMACEAVLLENEDFLHSFAEKSEGQGVFVEPLSLEGSASGAHHRPEAAIHFVTVQPKVAAWVARLLAGCYIVEDAAAAARLKEEVPFSQIVAKTGEIWHAAGWQLRGKGGENRQSVLARDNERRELAEKLANLSRQTEAAAQALESAQRQVKEVEASLAQAMEARQQIAARCASLRYEQEAGRKREEEAQNKFKSLQEEKARLAEKDSSGAEEQKRLEQEIERLAQLSREQTSRAETLANLLEENNRSSEAQGQCVMDLRVRAAAAEQRREGLARQETPMRQRLQELEENLRLRRAEIEDYQKRTEESRQNVADAEHTIQAAEAGMREANDALTALAAERQNLHGEIATLETSVDGERRRATEIQTRCGREEVGLAEQKMRLGSLVERVQTSYHVQLEEIAAPEVSETPATEDWGAMEAEVTELRDKLERMGPVNLEAITEFEELEQRQKFLQTQEEDLTKSKEQLVSAIRKINETAKTMFAETFEKIQAHFSKTFVELFGGGRASLLLVNEQDPLESGIEIAVKPPGKQLQNITLLSGGEKAMTAVALLFSIYMVKPSPFCVLDEMDAPLDESNILRFVRMLQQFVSQSQFVVITHNKRTISAADILYGVTMEEQGVSKIVSVKLTRKGEDPLFEKPEQEKPATDETDEAVTASEEAFA
ncbi:MAG: chromosome segregation protein SMC, partial [bacterium]